MPSFCAHRGEALGMAGHGDGCQLKLGLRASDSCVKSKVCFTVSNVGRNYPTHSGGLVAPEREREREREEKDSVEGRR